MEIFERASRANLHFETQVGRLTTNQLWDLPLTAIGQKVSIDGIYRRLNAELKTLDTDSLVQTKPDPRKVELTLQVDILKHIAASMLADKANAEKRADRMAKRERLLGAIEAADTKALESKSIEDLRKELAELDE